ncbi:hypothetical protein GH714_035526 [Hevea brasiliensis]|uniref:Uncharacterized protein n=1 Tax=Hevea brasiliensis TaxID=3981 RepID=A0A6A6NAF7_HEVBR|nr:hypothetical protein GH714_035526 [Hevea brasiliensis]
MVPAIVLWIIEFLTRQDSVSTLVLNSILSNTHIPILPTPRLKKTIALRSIHDEIANGSVSSETILDSLEIIEQLDQKERIKIPDSMRLAYCAVAVDCTMKHLWVVESKRKHDPEMFSEAVKTIWRERVDKLEFLKKSELVTDELREFKEEMEAALLDSNACVRLLEKATRNETLRLVMDYLKEALDEMGSPFLELLARTERERKEKEKDADKVGVKASSEPEVGVADGSARKEPGDWPDLMRF